MAGPRQFPIALKLRKAITIKKTALTRRRLVALDPGDLLRADPEARWASWQRARQAGVLSPNDVRTEEGWPASTDPTANSIEPPVSGGRPASDGAPTDGGTDANKISRLDDYRAA